MSKVKIQGDASGTGIFTVAAPATNTDRTITLPDVSATVLTSAGGTITGQLVINQNNSGGIAAISLPQDESTIQGPAANTAIRMGNNLVLRASVQTSIDTAGLGRVIIDSSGRVTMPYQPSAAVGSSGQSSASTIVWPIIHHNVGNHYNSLNGLFTCPVSGYYLVSIMVMSNASDTTMDIELQVNQATNQSLVPYQAGTGGAYNQVSGMTVISVSAGDTLSFKLNSGSIYGGSNGRHSAAVFRLLG